MLTLSSPCRLCEGMSSVNICKLGLCGGMVLLGVNSLNIRLQLNSDRTFICGAQGTVVVAELSGIWTN